MFYDYDPRNTRKIATAIVSFAIALLLFFVLSGHAHAAPTCNVDADTVDAVAEAVANKVVAAISTGGPTVTVDGGSVCPPIPACPPAPTTFRSCTNRGGAERCSNKTFLKAVQ